EGLRQSGLSLLRGTRGTLALGSIAQIWLAAGSLADALEPEPLREAARELMRRAASVESPASGSAWKLPRSSLPEGRTLVMGIVNATPDSFSDGGAYDPVARGLRLAEEGADILDVGGESTRPDAEPVEAKEERRRTEGVVRELATRTRLPISIDTTKASVAAAAVDAGAEIVHRKGDRQASPGQAPGERGRCRGRRVSRGSHRPRPRRGCDARGPGPRRRGAYVRCLTVRRKLAALPTRHQHCFSLREHST